MMYSGGIFQKPYTQIYTNIPSRKFYKTQDYFKNHVEKQTQKQRLFSQWKTETCNTAPIQ